MDLRPQREAGHLGSFSGYRVSLAKAPRALRVHFSHKATKHTKNFRQDSRDIQDGAALRHARRSSKVKAQQLELKAERDKRSHHPLR
jgi:hypothetical protein